jgi:hypothetical protein
MLLALAMAACGSSSSNTGVVVKAATNTARAAGYRLAGTISIVTAGTRAATTAMGLAGTFNRSTSRARLLTVGLANGHRFEISELVSPEAVYMGASALPGGSRLTGGKSWLKLNLSGGVGAVGVSSLPTSSDPTQFIDYLRAVSSATSSKGFDLVRGVQSAHYHATVDLDRYPGLVPQARRAAIQHSVTTLETALGSHTLPVDVWLDQYGLIRRLRVVLVECVGRTHFTFTMNLDLYSFGVQPSPSLPSSRSVYDLTPLITKALKRAKLGCTR